MGKLANNKFYKRTKNSLKTLLLLTEAMSLIFTASPRTNVVEPTNDVTIRPPVAGANAYPDKDSNNSDKNSLFLYINNKINSLKNKKSPSIYSPVTPSEELPDDYNNSNPEDNYDIIADDTSSLEDTYSVTSNETYENINTSAETTQNIEPEITEPITEPPVTEPVTEEITKPVTEPETTIPITEYITEPETTPITEPIKEQTTELVITEPVTEEITNPVTEPITESVTQPVKVETTQTPVTTPEPPKKVDPFDENYEIPELKNFKYGIYDEDKVTMQDLRFDQTEIIEMPSEFYEAEQAVLKALNTDENYAYVVLPSITTYDKLTSFMEAWYEKYHFNIYYGDEPSTFEGKNLKIFLNIQETKDSLPGYKYRYERDVQGRKYVEDAVASLGITEGMSQKEAIWRINNFVCDLLKYGYPKKELSIATIFEERTGVCSHYAILAHEMMRYCGIDCYMASGKLNSNGFFHKWNEIRFSNGEVYFVDPTFNDSYNNPTFRFLRKIDNPTTGGDGWKIVSAPDEGRPGYSDIRTDLTPEGEYAERIYSGFLCKEEIEGGKELYPNGYPLPKPDLPTQEQNEAEL